MNDWYSQTYAGNSLDTYLTALGIFLVGALALKIILGMVFTRLKRLAERSASTLDDFLVPNIEKSAMPLLYFSVLYLSTRDLHLSETVQSGLRTAGVVLLTFFTTRFLIDVVTYMMSKAWKGGANDQARDQEIKVVLPILRITFWSLALVFLLDNLGFKVSTVIAGLGIGGIAIALAAQTVLGDLLSYFAIVLDKPFVLGDSITLEGGFTGTIEHIGIKNTRIRSLGGELIVLPNSDLTSHRVRNYKHMTERRVVFKLGLTYDTPAEKMEKVPGLVQGIIEGMPDTRFDRCHFLEFGDSSLNVEAVYFVLTPDNNRYMDLQQGINLRLMRVFKENGLEFAYPTQTLYLKDRAGHPGA